MNTMKLKTWLALIVVLLCSNTALAVKEEGATRTSRFRWDGIKYEILSETDKTVKVIERIIDDYEGENYVNIPSYAYNDKNEAYKVVEISRYAFSMDVWLKKICIPSTIVKIVPGAFSGGQELTSIIIDKNNPKYTSGKNNDYIIDTETNTLITGAVNETNQDRFDVPEGVTRIENGAFSYRRRLKSIHLPNTVTSIGEKAFIICESLESINIPDNLKSIEKRAFESCRLLKSIYLPDGLTNIGDAAFAYCTQLQEIRLPNSLVSIGARAFYECALKSIEIPKNVIKVGKAVLSYCADLASIKVDAENPVYNSGEGCNAIIESKTNILIAACKNTTIPNGVKGIAGYAFSGIPISSITLPESIKFLGEYAFQATSLDSIVLPNSIDSIGEFAFFYLDFLKKAVLSSGLKKLPVGMFQLCNSLESITVPEGVTELGSGAFIDCWGLEKIELPSTLQKICSHAFENCHKLKHITCHAIEPPVVEGYGFGNLPDMHCTLIIPEGCEEAYRNNPKWARFFSGIGIEGPAEENIVDVYNLQGMLVKKQSGMKDLKATLPKGLYIVNGKKIMVR